MGWGKTRIWGYLLKVNTIYARKLVHEKYSNGARICYHKRWTQGKRVIAYLLAPGGGGLGMWVVDIRSTKHKNEVRGRNKCVTNAYSTVVGTQICAANTI